MKTVKTIFLAIIQLVKQACFLPQAIATVFTQRRRRLILDRGEAERLDRIRNPSKYLGK